VSDRRPRRARTAVRRPSGAPQDEPLWYKDAVFYELRIGTFQDSDGDGVGDLRGLASRLDYVQDLGVTTLWLLPFCPSPLRDDGYDISDYTNVRPDCGTLDDFKHVLREAHRRQLRVVTELVINHSSDQHPWFQRARRAAPGTPERDFYVWSDSPDRYAEARIIFPDFERSNWTWDPVANAYYWHRFYSHQPDLNFDNPEVRKAVLRFCDFWLRLGVDGMRLDAIPYLYEREGTHCENLPETHAFLKELRSYVDARFPDRMLLAEANQWPEDAVTYFGKGDECHMAFHFPVMPRLFMSLHMEDRFPIIDILSQTPPIPESCQWALFLRNHDELTLEMVTDEERDYMYRVYAHDAQARINLGIRRRLAPLLGNDRRRIELMNALLFALPGTPVIYYGDEIGMGDNFYLGDRNGVRTPMQWSSDRNAGFSRANPQRLYLPVVVDPEYHYESVNVEAQQSNPHSLLSWMKRLISLRRRHPAFGRGSIHFLSPQNRKVLAFLREFGDERILVVANLSRFVEYVELDLSAYRGAVPVELFGGHPFPPVGDLPYLLTLGPHSFYWFTLRSPEDAAQARERLAEMREAAVTVEGAWEDVFEGRNREALEAALARSMRGRRWFGGKALEVAGARIREAIRIPAGPQAARLLLVDVRYARGEQETYAVPVTFAEGERQLELRRHHPEAILAELRVRSGDGERPGVLIDALEDGDVCAALLDAIARRRRFAGDGGELVATPTGELRRLRGDAERLPSWLLRGEQSNSSVLYDDRFVLKIFRRLAPGLNPDLEVGRFLTERARFPHIPPVVGALEYRAGRGEPVTVGIRQGFVPNEGPAWRLALDQVDQFFERALARDRESGPPPEPTGGLLDRIAEEPPALAGELLGRTLETGRLLGQRTAELHRALASDRDDPAFSPEPFSSLYQRSRYQSMRNLVSRVFGLLHDRMAELPEELRGEAGAVADDQGRVLGIFEQILHGRLAAMRIRCHGDYHLGQVLYTGNDFVILDFEGEPARPLGERRLKRSPLVDVAGMLRSFDYAAHHPLLDPAHEGVIRSDDVARLAPCARFWRNWAGSSFLRAYLRTVEGAGLVPEERRDLTTLLDVFLLEKAVYELGYELNNRPGWAGIPLRGIRALLETRHDEAHDG
jgi:maltose alpha-D-glucosyltransferase / alpha-amylase